MDLTFGKEEIAFQQEVRDWLKDNLTPEIMGEIKAGRNAYMPKERLIDWQKRNGYAISFACEATLNIARTPDLLLGFLDRTTRQGLMLALPLIIVMLLAEAGLMTVARFAPQLRVDDLALSVRNIVFVSFLPIYAVFLIGYIRQDFGTLPSLVDLLRDTAPAGAAR